MCYSWGCGGNGGCAFWFLVSSFDIRAVVGLGLIVISYRYVLTFAHFLGFLGLLYSSREIHVSYYNTVTYRTLGVSFAYRWLLWEGRLGHGVAVLTETGWMDGV